MCSNYPRPPLPPTPRKRTTIVTEAEQDQPGPAPWTAWQKFLAWLLRLINRL